MNIKPGESVATFLRRHSLRKFSAAARLGVEKRVGTRWETVPLNYIAKAGDRFRIKNSGKGVVDAESLRELILFALTKKDA